MTQHTGVCVGGPMAGKFQVSDRRTFEAQETPPLPPVSPLRKDGVRAIPADLAITRHQYQHHQIGKAGIFVCSPMTLEQALDEMSAAYVRYCGR